MILISKTRLAWLPIITYPALTRIYTPTQFGLFSLFSSLVFLLGANSGLKYDAAIVLPRKDSDAGNILTLATVAALTINMLLFVTVPLWDDLVVKAYKNELIRPWLYLLPAANLLLFSVTSLWFYYTRKKKYKLIFAAAVYTMAYFKGMPFKETLIIYSGVMTVFYFALLAVNYYVVYRSAKAAN